jgi:hypothetical protein
MPNHPIYMKRSRLHSDRTARRYRDHRDLAGTLPALVMQSKANRVSCTNNLRQLGWAFICADNYNDRLPSTPFNPENPGSRECYSCSGNPGKAANSRTDNLGHLYATIWSPAKTFMIRLRHLKSIPIKFEMQHFKVTIPWRWFRRGQCAGNYILSAIRPPHSQSS